MRKRLHPRKCNLQKAAEADTRGGDTDDVAVSLGVGVLAAGNVLLAVLLEEIGQASSTKDRDGDVKLSAALAKTETFATNSTEDVGEDTNVVLADTLTLVDLVAARHLGTITTLVHCILDLSAFPFMLLRQETPNCLPASKLLTLQGSGCPRELLLSVSRVGLGQHGLPTFRQSILKDRRVYGVRMNVSKFSPADQRTLPVFPQTPTGRDAYRCIWRSGQPETRGR